MTKMILIFSLIFFVSITDGKVITEDKSKAVDTYFPYLENVVKAMDSNKYDKASELLKKARTCFHEKKEACGFFYADYMQLAGLIYMEFGLYEKAENAFREVLKHNPERIKIALLLGEVLFRQSLYEEALFYFEKGFKEGRKTPSYFVLKAEAEKRCSLYYEARKTLQSGMDSHKNNSIILRQTVILYAENGFLESAAEILGRNRKYLPGNESLYIYIADLFLKEGSLQKAALILEEASIVNPSNSSIVEMLAYVYAESGMPEISGRIFKKLVAAKPETAFNSAEQYRISGNFYEALRMNRFIPEKKLRLKQKFRIYLSMESFSRAYSLSFKLLDLYPNDDELIYYSAYCAFMSADYIKTLEFMDKLKSGGFVKLGNELRSAALKCLEEPFLCI